MTKTNIDTFYEQYLIDGSKQWSFNLPFLCVKCANCCTWGSFRSAGYIILDDQIRIKKLMQIIKPYVEEYNRIFHENPIKGQNYRNNTKCPFFNSDNLCDIYEIRPEGCRLYPKTDFGMDSQEGFCESIDRFKKFRKALLKRYVWLGKRTFFIHEDGIKPVILSDKRYERCVTKLIKSGITEKELKLFKEVNSKRI